MRITKIRNKNNEKLTEKQFVSLMTKLSKSLTKKGFITTIELVKPECFTQLNLSNHGSSFVIDLNKLGYNARINEWTIRHTKLGYKRTNVPTWSQREQYNHTINDVLDSLNYKANIKSGEYLVRDYNSGRVTEWDMPDVYHSQFGSLVVPNVLEVVSLKKAEEAVAFFGINAPFIQVGE